MNFQRRAQRLLLEGPHGVFEQLAVQFVADGGDVAALLRAEDIAGATDLQVAQSDLEPGPQLGELLDRLQPPRRGLRHRPAAL